MFQLVQGVFPKLRWKLVCNTPSAPKWLFIMMLVAHGRLYTKDKMIHWGISVNPVCPLCESENESISHLFFQCSVSASVWNKLLQWLGQRRQAKAWEEELTLAVNHHNGNSVATTIYRMALTGCIYYMWQERNQIVFQGKRRKISDLVKRIIQDVYFRGCLKVKLTKYLMMLNYYHS